MSLSPTRSYARRSVIVIVLTAIALILLGCPQQSEKPEPAFSVGIDVGTKVTASVPADGIWHATSYMARRGDFLIFRPVGTALDVNREILQVRIAHGMTQIIKSEQGQRISRSGDIDIRIAPQAVKSFPDSTLNIEIENENKK
jgi:hypothetical protein